MSIHHYQTIMARVHLIQSTNTSELHNQQTQNLCMGMMLRLVVIILVFIQILVIRTRVLHSGIGQATNQITNSKDSPEIALNTNIIKNTQDPNTNT